MAHDLLAGFRKILRLRRNFAGLHVRGNRGAPRRMFKKPVQQGRSERLKMILPSLLVYVAQDGPDESPTARVQRGPSEAARCASTEDRQASSPSLLREQGIRAGVILLYASSASPTGPRRPTTSLRPSRPAAPTIPSDSICSIIRAARG